MILSAYKISPFEKIRQIQFANFFSNLGITLSPEDIEKCFKICDSENYEQEAITIDISGLVHLNDIYPDKFKPINDVRENMRKKIFGNVVYLNIVNRKEIAPTIIAFVKQNERYPNEGCVNKLKQIFLGRPPLFRYDFYDINASDGTISKYVTKYCHLYCPEKKVDNSVIKKQVVVTRSNSGFKFTNRSIDKILSRGASTNSHFIIPTNPVSFKNSVPNTRNSNKSS